MRALFLMCCLSGLAGCSGILPSTPLSTTPERSCAPLHPTRFQPQIEEPAGDCQPELSLSAQSLEVARVMDVLPLLARRTTLERAGETHSMAFLEL